MRKFLIVLLLLSSANLAGADCAWVVWFKTYKFETKETIWNRRAAAPSFEMCMAVTEEAASSMLKYFGADYKITYESKASYTVEQKGIRRSFSFQCFPDTVDPRK